MMVCNLVLIKISVFYFFLQKVELNILAIELLVVFKVIVEVEAKKYFSSQSTACSFR